MNPSTKVDQWADVHATKKFLTIRSKEGYSYGEFDPNGIGFELETTASDVDLGKAVLDALSASRCVMPNELPPCEVRRAAYIAHRESLRLKYGYFSIRALLKGMTSCYIKASQTQVEIIPMQQVKQDTWRSIEDQKELIPREAPMDELGRAVRRALAATP